MAFAGTLETKSMELGDCRGGDCGQRGSRGNTKPLDEFVPAEEVGRIAFAERSEAFVGIAFNNVLG